MKQKIVTFVNRIMFILIFILSFKSTYAQNLNYIVSTFLAGFNIFIYPGFFYFKANQERVEQDLMEDSNDVCENLMEKSKITKPKSESGLSSLFNQNEIYSKDGDSMKSCRAHKSWCSFERKALFGLFYTWFGVLFTLGNTTIITYMILIYNNKCLYYTLHPPCKDNKRYGDLADEIFE
jgi:hypothetical protein